MITEALPEIPIFQDLTREQIAELSSWLTRQTYEPGQEIFPEGSPPAALFVLARGKVEVLKKSEQGAYRITALEGPSVFGEMGFLTGEAHSAGIVALTPIVVGMLPLEIFEARLSENNTTALRIGLNIGRIACQRLRATTDKLLLLSLTCTPAFASQEGRHVSRRLTEICQRIFQQQQQQGRGQK